MPADAAIVFAAVVSMFVVFGAVLYWGERQTRTLQQSGGETRRRAF